MELKIYQKCILNYFPKHSNRKKDFFFVKKKRKITNMFWVFPIEEFREFSFLETNTAKLNWSW